jgi:hypothetical protein
MRATVCLLGFLGSNMHYFAFGCVDFNCQQSDQFAISFRFLCSLRQSSHDSMVLYSYVSCAYIWMLQSSRQEMSLTNRIKRHGPSTLPWGIPLCTSAQFERLFLTLALCLLPIIYTLSHFSTCPSILTMLPEIRMNH